MVPRAFDPVSETRIARESVAVEDQAVLVFDGVFLLRPELRAHWDLSIYLDVAPEVTLARARERDRANFGSLKEVDLRYRERCIPGQPFHRGEADPRAVADVLVDVTDPELYEQYKLRSKPLLDRHGGEYVVRGGALSVKETDLWSPTRLVVIRLPSTADAEAFYQCPEYQDVLKISRQSAKRTLCIADGV